MTGSGGGPRPGEGDHLVRLDGGWSLWRSICLRSAGFPIALLEPLGSPLAARAADALHPPGDASPERRRAAAETCADEIARISAYVRELAGSPRFREAVTWQNRTVIETGLDPLLRRPAGASDSSSRRKELLAASYLQRYCAKNDTIGFFGPLGWGELAAGGAPVDLAPMPDLLARRITYFEHWAVDELARVLAADPALRRHLAPRRHPTVRLEGNQLWDARGRVTELPPAYARALAACDGVRAAGDIADQLAADEELALDGPDEVYDLLEELAEKNLALWTLEIPTAEPHAERAFERALEGAPSDPSIDAARGALAQLERARAEVAAAGGDVDRLAPALIQVEQVFEKLTARSAHRRAGAMYAGRMVVHEECLRAARLRLGGDLIAALAPPLQLVLASARWFCWSVATRYLTAVRDAHAELRACHGSAVDYLRLWEHIAPLFADAERSSPLAAEAQGELQRRWARVLDLPAHDPGRPREPARARSSAGLAERVRQAFDAPGPGWPWARYHCPDLMIAAPGPDAAARGEFLLVLGEVHVAAHSYLMPGWVGVSPDPGAMVRAYEADMGVTCVFPVTSRHQATRTDQASPSWRDFDLELGDTRSPRPRDRVLAIADLVAEEVDGQLRIRTRDGRHSFDAMVFLGYYLTAECMSRFHMFAEAPHTPRVTIDRLVVGRERWTFAPRDLVFCRPSWERVDRFIGARGWALAHGLPRRVFVKVPEEPKPVYIDLESPLFVDLLARIVRKASRVVVTEMLPGPDDCWLVDADGNRYTSELRLAAVDPVAWSDESSGARRW